MATAVEEDEEADTAVDDGIDDEEEGPDAVVAAPVTVSTTLISIQPLGP